ncbi:DUF3261 domain-containing protein [Paraliomyxa miuraensis]|uniref:DUF3261 domain-containing protein n=1 Tax=Paraliomyxa miuraensis TaxID=376150 RepID=UPI0022557161|nr:DUF3261 domain-containing protein [Paraliomyxa miuraensis]MCX4247042.1 DUF3261 domain-containing protein [Paraliomyxa miuraensis]
MRRTTVRLAWGLVVLLAVGCRPKAPPGSYPGELVEPSSVARDFMLRQRAEGSYGEREVAFEAVVQKQGDTLMVLTLTPYGSRAFLVEQKGQEVRVEKFIPRDLPFDPRFILLDVQRVFLKGLPDGPRDDGWHRQRIDDEIVRERWEGGRLHERTYARRDRQPKGEIVVRYEGGWVPGERPPSIELHNGWFGYRLVLDTSDYQVL